MADIVIDMDVVSFGFRQDARYTENYGPAIQGHRAVISFMTVAELRFGALLRQWGQKRLAELQAYVERHYVRYYVSETICDIWATLIWEEKAAGANLKRVGCLDRGNVGRAWCSPRFT